jgi:hypothetical protein
MVLLMFVGALVLLCLIAFGLSGAGSVKDFTKGNFSGGEESLPGPIRKALGHWF